MKTLQQSINQGEQALNQVIEAIRSYQVTKQITVDNAASTILKLSKEFQAAMVDLDEARTELVAEQIHKGGSTTKTAEKVNHAASEVERVRATLEAVSCISGFVLMEIEKKLKRKRFDLSQNRNTRKGWELDFPVTLHDKKNAKIKAEAYKKLDEEETVLIKEIEEIEETINFLKEMQKKHKHDFITDAETAAKAKDCLNIGAYAYGARKRICQDIRDAYLKNKDEINRLKEENLELENALTHLRPDCVVEYLYGGEVANVLWPDLLNPQYNRDSGITKHRIDTTIRQLAETNI